MQAENEQFALLYVELLRRGPNACFECPKAHATAQKVAKHLIGQNIGLSEAYEPYAEVMGVCSDGPNRHPFSAQKVCRHPDAEVETSEELTEQIIEKIIETNILNA